MLALCRKLVWEDADTGSNAGAAIHEKRQPAGQQFGEEQLGGVVASQAIWLATPGPSSSITLKFALHSPLDPCFLLLSVFRLRYT